MVVGTARHTQGSRSWIAVLMQKIIFLKIVIAKLNLFCNQKCVEYYVPARIPEEANNIFFGSLMIILQNINKKRKRIHNCRHNFVGLVLTCSSELGE